LASAFIIFKVTSINERGYSVPFHLLKKMGVQRMYCHQASSQTFPAEGISQTSPRNAYITVNNDVKRRAMELV
jgi:hypothetical protein